MSACSSMGLHQYSNSGEPYCKSTKGTSVTRFNTVNETDTNPLNNLHNVPPLISCVLVISLKHSTEAIFNAELHILYVLYKGSNKLV